MVLVEKDPSPRPVRTTQGGAKADQSPRKAEHKGQEDQGVNRPAYLCLSKEAPLKEPIQDQYLGDGKEPQRKECAQDALCDPQDLVFVTPLDSGVKTSREPDRSCADEPDQEEQQGDDRCRVTNRQGGRMTGHTNNALGRQHHSRSAYLIPFRMAAPA